MRSMVEGLLRATSRRHELEHPFQIRENITRCDAQGREPLIRQPFVADLIPKLSTGGIMHLAINLYRDART